MTAGAGLGRRTSASGWTLFSGYTVLCTADDGSIGGGEEGLFHRDARILSRYRLTIDGREPELVKAAQPEADRWIGVLQLRRPGGSASGPLLPQDALELVLDRVAGPGLSEHLRVTNHSAVPCRTQLTIELDSDFADRAEVPGEPRKRGTIERDPAPRDAPGLELHLDASVDGRHDRRGLRIDADARERPQVSAQGISFQLDLEPRGRWEAAVRYRVLERGVWRVRETGAADIRARQRAVWRRRRPTISCSEPLRTAFERAADDLFDLRNWELEEQLLGRTDGSAWVCNAGVPMFTGIFGRDIVTAGWQSMMLGPRALAGALDVVATTQARSDDPWRDAEPGKLIHEQRSGPLTALGLSPRDAYYGTQTTPAMFVLALSELWHWTGNDDVLRRHVGVARRAMDWARRAGDLDRGGFLTYRRRSPQGLRNQAWKDSDEAIRHVDGSIADVPIASVEEQAFLILALERLGEILVALEDKHAAAEYLECARSLRRRWDAAFWMPDERFYAMALDADRRQIRSIGSNPGHALGAGVVPPDRARAVADRLFAPDLFSGWGIRTLSDRHRSYNPFAYHLGSVWPVEQATFALGFKRYGLDRHLDRLVEAVFEAAAGSPDSRLPEALAGHARSDIPVPVPYPAANAPQAWSASAIVQLVQIMLGFYPFAPLGVLALVRPRLPAFVPDLSVHGLRVGDATVDLRFDRRPDGSASWRVTRRRGRLLVVGTGPPEDVDTPDWIERVEFAALGHMPGRLARAARIAIGRETGR